jgi:hypothetical protein
MPRGIAATGKKKAQEKISCACHFLAMKLT